MTSETIYELSSTQWEYNPTVVRNLVSQKWDSFVAAALFFCGFACQAVSYYLPKISIHHSCCDILLAVILLGVLYLTGTLITHLMIERGVKEVTAMHERDKQRAEEANKHLPA